MGSVAAKESEESVVGGRCAEESAELATPDRSDCSTRRTAGAAARRVTAAVEARLASPPSPPEDAIGAEVRLLIGNGVAELEVEAAMANKGGEKK